MGGRLLVACSVGLIPVQLCSMQVRRARKCAECANFRFLLIKYHTND